MKKNTFKILLGSLLFVGIASCESDDSSIVDGMPDAVVNTDGADAPATDAPATDAPATDAPADGGQE